jgi:thiol-disulfide isomerase/thioredoxin
MKRIRSIFVATILFVFIPALASAAEPNQQALASDEEIYGKFAIGPKTPTPLVQAVAEINEKVAKYAAMNVASTVDGTKRAFPPLAVDDVIAVIRKWDRAKTPVADASYRIYEQIANTKVLPPHSMLELNDRWFERGTHEHRVLQIKLTAMTGKNQGDEFVVREHELDQRPYFKPHPGYRWISRPAPKDPTHGWTNWFNGQLRVSFDENHAKGLEVEINRSNEILSSQVVAFDKELNPFDFNCHVVGAYNGFVRERYRLNYADLPGEKIAFVGIEAVTRDDLNRLAAAASARLNAQDVKLLPLPKLGQNYDFSLTAAGKQIESSQLRGKVVLIDIWASWCAPCLKKMPELKDLYAKWHDQGLEVIGISFDDDAEAAQAVIDGMKLPWPSAILKSDSEVRKLWEQRDRVTRLPTVLVIDAEGVLQFELFSDSGKVEEKISRLIAGEKSSTAETEGK